MGGTPCERPADFSIEKHLKDSFGIFTAKGSHTVRLKLDAFVGQLVRIGPKKGGHWEVVNP